MKNKIRPPGETNVAVDEIANNIAAISGGMKKLRSSRLNDKAIQILLYHACGRSVQIGDIQRVLNELENLEKTYLKQKKER